jgi:hypothetical protein
MSFETETKTSIKISYSDIIRYMNNRPKKHVKVHPVEPEPDLHAPRWRYMNVEDFYKMNGPHVVSPLIEHMRPENV